MNPKQIAKEIDKLILLIEDETGSCGNNPLFYNQIAKELVKLKPYALDKLHDILNVAVVLERL